MPWNDRLSTGEVTRSPQRPQALTGEDPGSPQGQHKIMIIWPRQDLPPLEGTLPVCRIMIAGL